MEKEAEENCNSKEGAEMEKEVVVGKETVEEENYNNKLVEVEKAKEVHAETCSH